jgi:LPXTG-motif cell wall-anchored protein
MQKTVRRLLIGLCAAPMVIGLTAQEMPLTTKQQLKGTASAKTEQLRGTVTFVEGNRLVVKMSTGDLRTFEVPNERRFIIDGKELTVNELQPGTKLTATVTTTTTPVTERTTTIGTGKVWFVSGNNVIITLPNNENRMYKVNENYRFNVSGQQASVHDLRKGMTIAAEKIVEEPRTEISSDVAVTGSAPPPPRPVTTEVARAPEPRPRPAPVVSHAPAAAPTPPPAAAAAPAPAEPEPMPAELPKTGSPVPLLGVAGVLLIGAWLSLRSSRIF